MPHRPVSPKNNLHKLTSTLNDQKGAMLIMALVFSMLFTVMAIGIAGMINYQQKLGLKKISWHRALAAAEAGVNYYRWHLAHAPEDFTDNSGEPGPYLHDYKDTFGNTVGQFSLNISPPSACSNTAVIESTGWALENPATKRKVKVKYGRPTMAQFAFLTNSNVWFGDTETLSGPLHSNGGIRMDGYNDGSTTSAKKTYICGPEHGCSYQTKPGVWGSGGDSNLWDFPVSNVDFEAVTTDLASLKTLAKASDCGGGNDCYWSQQGLGYHLKFKDNGTFDLYRVTRLYNPVWGYDGSRWLRKSDDFDRETLVGNYNIPANCGIIFIEDDLWIDGVLDGKVTVVAAKLPDSSSNPQIVINGNLTYKAKDGSDSLGLISQSDIYVPLYAAEDNLEIDGALMAQKGHVFRKYYTNSGHYSLPWEARNYVLRNSITIYGVIITNTVWTWSWVSGSGSTVSGYKNTETLYDPNLTYNPPPGFPAAGDYQFLDWEETTEK